MFEPMVKHIPAAAKGLAEIRHITITEQAVRMMLIRQAATRGREPATPAGKYCQLILKGEGLVMSDTNLEKDTNYSVVSRAQGDVLIAGLGIGMILVPTLAKTSVMSVTVVELHQDVIDLVAPHFKRDPRFEVINADIFSWKPPKGFGYDTIYFDVWPSICKSNLNDMQKLERRFRPFLRENGWMNSWAKERCKKF